MIELNDLIGKPYKDNGRGPDAYDCWGLCMEVMRRAGRDLPDISIPSADDSRRDLVELQRRRNFRKIPQAQPWSLVLFRIFDDQNKEKWHVGVVLEGGQRFVHITGKSCVAIVALNHPVWGLFLEGFYHYVVD